ncbi:MAG: hypothetical protein GF329_17635, partial [Candidatus Lokiarchaeota archaeon]|nr:hypothetical protein [Candidatus Lokiarchaeota archaeon]
MTKKLIDLKLIGNGSMKKIAKKVNRFLEKEDLESVEKFKSKLIKKIKKIDLSQYYHLSAHNFDLIGEAKKDINLLGDIYRILSVIPLSEEDLNELKSPMEDLSYLNGHYILSYMQTPVIAIYDGLFSILENNLSIVPLELLIFFTRSGISTYYSNAIKLMAEKLDRNAFLDELKELIIEARKNYKFIGMLEVLNEMEYEVPPDYILPKVYEKNFKNLIKNLKYEENRITAKALGNGIFKSLAISDPKIAKETISDFKKYIENWRLKYNEKKFVNKIINQALLFLKSQEPKESTIIQKSVNELKESIEESIIEDPEQLYDTVKYLLENKGEESIPTCCKAYFSLKDFNIGDKMLNFLFDKYPSESFEQLTDYIIRILKNKFNQSARDYLLKKLEPLFKHTTKIISQPKEHLEPSFSFDKDFKLFSDIITAIIGKNIGRYESLLKSNRNQFTNEGMVFFLNKLIDKFAIDAPKLEKIESKGVEKAEVQEPIGFGEVIDESNLMELIRIEPIEAKIENAHKLLLEDITLNGKKDLVAIGINNIAVIDQDLRVLYNKKFNFKFTPPEDDETELSPIECEAALEDIDNDGNLELIITAFSETSTILLIIRIKENFLILHREEIPFPAKVRSIYIYKTLDKKEKRIIMGLTREFKNAPSHLKHELSRFPQIKLFKFENNELIEINSTGSGLLKSFKIPEHAQAKTDAFFPMSWCLNIHDLMGDQNKEIIVRFSIYPLYNYFLVFDNLENDALDLTYCEPLLISSKKKNKLWKKDWDFQYVNENGYVVHVSFNSKKYRIENAVINTSFCPDIVELKGDLFFVQSEGVTVGKSAKESTGRYVKASETPFHYRHRDYVTIYQWHNKKGFIEKSWNELDRGYIKRPLRILDIDNDGDLELITDVDGNGLINIYKMKKYNLELDFNFDADVYAKACVGDLLGTGEDQITCVYNNG